MLRPEYLEGLPDEILKLFSEAEQEILADMARRISTYDFWIPAADYQNEKLREAGVMQDDIIRVLSQTTRKSESELRSMMQEAGSMALHTDEKVYEAAGMRTPSITDSKPLKAILNAGYKATVQEMKNICRTTARTATKQFEDALDRAWLKVSSGAFDAESAIRSAVKELSEKGIQSIKYPSGRTDSLEVSVRRAVVTGVNQTAGQLQEELADELGCDLVEVTAHSGARPEHAVWQGKIYSRSGNDPKYPPFRQSTGYGTGAGLCGWNCGHSFGPYIEGSTPVWTDEQLADLNAPKYEYNGKKLTEYEASQQQRYNERQIRRWKREETSMKDAGLDSSEAAAKVKEWQGRHQEFLAQTGFKRQYGREQNINTTKNVGISVDISEENGRIKSTTDRNGVSALQTVQTIGKIDIQKYKCVTPEIMTDEVIITDERIGHIKERHPNDYERFCSYIPQIVEDPDYIIEANKPNTAVVLKEIQASGERFKLILRLKVDSDPDGYKNSIMSFWLIGDTTWRKTIKNKKVLYKRE